MQLYDYETVANYPHTFRPSGRSTQRAHTHAHLHLPPSLRACRVLDSAKLALSEGERRYVREAMYPADTCPSGTMGNLGELPRGPARRSCSFRPNSSRTGWRSVYIGR